MVETKDRIYFISCSGAKDLNSETIKKSGYSISVPYLGNAFFLRIIREIWFRLHLPFESIWYNKKIDCKDKVIVVYDSLMREKYIKWLRDKYPDNRIILYYINPVERSVYPSKTICECCEVYTSDADDCKKYGIHFLDCYYHNYAKIDKSKIEYDIFYIGRDKNRAKQLFELKEQFASVGLTTELYITAPRRFLFWKHKPYYKPLINYEEALRKTASARAILLLANGAQNGMTTRVFESVFNKIKLITDNVQMKNNVFYHPNNMFILGVDSISNLPAFLDLPWHEYNQADLAKYDFDYWIKKVISLGSE